MYRLIAAALMLLPGLALAQSTGTPTVPGYNTICPGGSACWKPYDTTGAGIPVITNPTSYTIVALDVATVTTGGTAVTALTAGHKTKGGWLQNPPSATINLCINEQGTASGTTSAGATTCIVPGQSYYLTPSTGAVSVVTSDSSHPFSGQGYN